MSALTSVLMPLLLQSGAPAEATPDCSDDRGQDRCSAEARETQRALYGVPTAEEMTADGTQMVRAFFVDGYGRDVGMVTAMRRAGESPRVEARGVPLESSGAAGTVLMSTLTLPQWTELVGSVEYVDRDLAPIVRNGNVIPPAPCLHSWVSTIEVIDADGAVRRKTQDACGEGLVTNAAFGLATVAVNADPACALMDPALVRNDVIRLAACRTLSGDRLAAAEAWNMLAQSGFTSPERHSEPELVQYFYDRAIIEGVAVENSSTAGARWQTIMNGGRFWPTRVRGKSADSVQVEGTVSRPQGARDGEWLQVPVSMQWTRRNGFGFRLESLNLATLPASD